MEQIEIEDVKKIDVPPRASKKGLRKKKILIGTVTLLLLICVAFAGAAYSASNALPGDALYQFKTTIVEEVFAQTKLNNEAKAQYAVHRLENRLYELQLLAADTSTSSEETISQIMWLIEQHAGVIQSKVAENNSLPSERKVDFLTNAVAITRAQEIFIEETPEFANVESTINKTEQTLDSSLRNSVNVFASSTDTANVVSYLQQQVTEVSELLPTVANGSRAQRVAERRIADTNEAIQDNQFGEALYYIVKAKEAIAVDQYLYAAERGFIDGISEEAGPIPEGS